MALWQWSKTPIVNQTADPTINWSEGQAPSTVNDSDRAMMARIAEWRDDTSGVLFSGGTSTAYSLTSNQGVQTPAPVQGQLISWTPHVTNGLNPTLSVDGGTAFPIQTSVGTPVQSGVMLAQTPYTMMYNGAGPAWILRNFYSNPFTVSVGMIMMWPITSALPSSAYAYVNGQAINRTTYGVLFAMFGTYYGPGDGLSTFNLPNFNGVAIFGLDGMGGSAPRGTITTGNGNWNGQTLGAPFVASSGTPGNEQRTLSVGQMPQHSHANSLSDPQHQHTVPVSSPVNVVAGGGVGTFQNTVEVNSGSTNTNSVSTGVTISNANAGSSQAFPAMPPGISMPFIMRII